MNADPLYVVTAISNPVRFKSRYALYKNFAKHVTDSGAKLYTVEIAYGDRPHEVTEPNNPQHIQLRTDHELWLKESAINVGVQRLPANWKYMAWVDADVTFLRPDWVDETKHQLQHHDVVQMFSHCQDLWHNYTVVPDASGGESLPGMIHQHVYGGSWGKKAYANHPGHCGYAWAIKRAPYDHLGGLIDWSICGANDHHMARGLIGDIRESINSKSSPQLIESLQSWGERAKGLRKNVGFVPGMIAHHWHGPKVNRGYQWRWKILVDSQFNPYKDIKRDAHGLYRLVDDGTPRFIKLRDDLRAYFRQRNEDSLDL
jgi:hypothetical protein